MLSILWYTHQSEKELFAEAEKEGLWFTKQVLICFSNLFCLSKKPREHTIRPLQEVTRIAREEGEHRQTKGERPPAW